MGEASWSPKKWWNQKPPQRANRIFVKGAKFNNPPPVLQRRRASGQHHDAGHPRNGAVYLGGVYLLLAAQHAVDARHCTAPAQAAGRLAVVASFALIAFAGQLFWTSIPIAVVD